MVDRAVGGPLEDRITGQTVRPEQRQRGLSLTTGVFAKAAVRGLALPEKQEASFNVPGARRGRSMGFPRTQQGQQRQRSAGDVVALGADSAAGARAADVELVQRPMAIRCLMA